MSTRLAVRNLLRDALVTMAPSAEPNLEEQYLHDGPGQLAGMFGSLAADPEVLVDLGGGLVAGGDGTFPPTGDGPFVGDVVARGEFSGAVDFETDWTITTAPTPESVAFLSIADDSGAGSADHGGNDRSLLLLGGDTSATAKLPVSLLAGRAYSLAAWCQKVLDDAGSVSVRLYDPALALYLKPDGTWTGTPTDAVAAGTFDSGATWFGSAGIPFTVRGDTADAAVSFELQYYLESAGVTGGRFDDVSITLVVGADLMAIVGNHNIPLSAAPVWESSDDGLSWTTRATFAVAKDQFWALLDSPVTARFHRFKVQGTPIVKYFVGDLVLAATVTVPQGPEDLSILYEERGQARLAGPAGVEYVSNRGPFPIRTVSFSMTFRVAAEVEEARRILIDELRGGEEPCIVFPEDTQLPDLAVFGRISQPVEFRLSPIRGDLPEGAGQERLARVSLTFVEGMGFEDNG